MCILLLLSAIPFSARAADYVVVCRIPWPSVQGTCHADLVAIDGDAGRYTSWLNGLFLLHYVGTFEWTLSWGDDAQSWFRLVCVGAGATSDCESARGLGRSIHVGDQITFDGSATTGVGDVGTLLYGVAFRDPSSPTLSGPSRGVEVVSGSARARTGRGRGIETPGPVISARRACRATS